MLLSIRDGVGDRSWTLAEPRTENWCGVMGKPPSSYVGGSAAAATAPPSTKVATSTVIGSKFFVITLH